MRWLSGRSVDFLDWLPTDGAVGIVVRCKTAFTTAAAGATSFDVFLAGGLLSQSHSLTHLLKMLESASPF